jgi:hypothetical protein
MNNIINSFGKLFLTPSISIADAVVIFLLTMLQGWWMFAIIPWMFISFKLKVKYDT